MLNVENIIKLANFIEKSNYAFDMNSMVVNTKCGSAGCIGGHASLLWPQVAEPGPMNLQSFSARALAKELGISDKEAAELCYMRSLARKERDWDIFDRVTRGDAVEVLHKLASTGRVDWSHVESLKLGGTE
jgi:hypothetical protein